MMIKAFLIEHLFHTRQSAKSFPAAPNLILSSTLSTPRPVQMKTLKPFAWVAQLDVVA